MRIPSSRFPINRFLIKKKYVYRAKLFLDKNSLLTLYYSYIQTYLSYTNLSWGSTNRTNLEKLLIQQKHAVRIISNRTRFDHTNELSKPQKILNIYKLNILSVAVFMYQIRNKTTPLTFPGSFEKICYGYPTNFSQFNYKFLKTHLAKANSESYLEGLPYGITFSKIVKKKLNHFRSLNLN